MQTKNFIEFFFPKNLTCEQMQILFKKSTVKVKIISAIEKKYFFCNMYLKFSWFYCSDLHRHFNFFCSALQNTIFTFTK